MNPFLLKNILEMQRFVVMLLILVSSVGKSQKLLDRINTVENMRLANDYFMKT